MTRSEFIEKLLKVFPHHTEQEVEAFLTIFIDEVTKALEKDERIELRGFGSFSVKERPGRIGSDPRTGERIRINKRYVPYFRAGKSLLNTLNAK